MGERQIRFEADTSIGPHVQAMATPQPPGQQGQQQHQGQQQQQQGPQQPPPRRLTIRELQERRRRAELTHEVLDAAIRYIMDDEEVGRLVRAGDDRVLLELERKVNEGLATLRAAGPGKQTATWVDQSFLN